MGYDTDFYGRIAIVPPLNQAERDYLRRFVPIHPEDRECGPYALNGRRGEGHSDPPNHNASVGSQPDSWCQWISSEDGSSLEWDGEEKFYEAERWMAYLIEHFLRPGARAQLVTDPQLAAFSFDHVLNGEIGAIGEDPDDRLLLRVTANEVFVLEGRIVYGDPVRVAAL